MRVKCIHRWSLASWEYESAEYGDTDMIPRSIRCRRIGQPWGTDGVEGRLAGGESYSWATSGSPGANHLKAKVCEARRVTFEHWPTSAPLGHGSP